jgi:hypothetical protein
VRTSFETATKNASDFIRHHVRLNFIQDDGSSLKERNAKLKKSLDDPQAPASLKEAARASLERDRTPAINSYEHWLVARFWELHSGRAQGPHGPAPLSFNDILSFVEVVGEDLEPIEAQALKAVDGAYLDAVFTEQNNARGSA